MRKVDIKSGDRFCRLTIICEVEKRKGFRYFECKCDCGTIKVIAMGALRKGVTKSCGCLQSELKKQPNLHTRSENYQYVGTRMYSIWVGMRKRCNNQKDRAYRWYGAKGVKVCKSWNRFINFRKWALKNGYTDGLTIDRIDSKGNYKPANCRWITIEENRRRALCY